MIEGALSCGEAAATKRNQVTNAVVCGPDSRAAGAGSSPWAICLTTEVLSNMLLLHIVANELYCWAQKMEDRG